MVSEYELTERARHARERSHSVYSGYSVGAALLADGEVYQGANVEVAGRSTSVHAEMLAAFNAVFDGQQDFEKLAICQDKRVGVCALCAHTLANFTDELVILEVVPGYSEVTEHRLSEMMDGLYTPGNASEVNGE